MIVKLIDGPKHNKKYKLRDKNIAFLKYKNGHYGRLSGSRIDEFYWWNIAPPIAISKKGSPMIPVKSYINRK